MVLRRSVRRGAARGLAALGGVTTAAAEPATRLARRLGLADAVVIGLGSMIGAGVFAAFGPAAEAAGAGLLIGLAIAGGVAFCNATSSAQLAAVYPQSGGTYVYGREQLSPFFGYLAGFAFVVGKLASLTAMALTFGAYAGRRHARSPSRPSSRSPRSTSPARRPLVATRDRRR